MNIKNIIIAASALSIAVSCVDDRNNCMVDDSFGFNNAVGENVVTLPIYGESYDLAVIKSGKGVQEGVVDVYSSNTELLAYNEEHGTKFFPISNDGDVFSFSDASLAFSAEEVSKTLTISWDAAKVAAYMNKQIDSDNKYCIPVSLKSSDLEVNDGRNIFILNLVTSTVTAEQTLLGKTIEWESEASEETMNITLRIDRTIPTLDLELGFDIDESLVAKYNEENGTAYAAAPAGLITLGNTPCIKAGEDFVYLPVTLNTAVLVDEATGLIKADWDGYVAPIKLTSMSIDGVNVNNGVTYFVLKGIRPVPPQLFNRMWGFYATSSTEPWQSAFGLSDARNITMDDEYVYVPQSAGGDPVLKAISIKDPAVVKNVNVEGISGGTHTLSCVRMVPNTDPNVNGGKDILLATNLSLGDGSHLNYYAWLNGIDNPPTLSLVDDSGRRMGDKFIVVGSWNAGEIYAKDYNTGNIVRNAMTGNRIGEWPGADGLAYARGRFDYNGSVPAAAGTIGSAYVYPGTEKAGSDVPANLFVTSTAGANWLTNNAGTNVYVSTAELPLGMTHGYNFFTDKVTGSKYVAYVALDASQAMGSVKVISDFNGTPDGLLSVLQSQKVVYEAPVQDELDATAVSPCPATHSTGDCTVREINGETYMAVMIQNVGLSLFKLNAGFSAE